MPEAESIQPFVESKEPTTVLDAYDAVISLGEARVLSLAMQIWNDLSPEARLEIQKTAYTTYDTSIAQSERYTRQLLVFTYVNRAPGEPLEYPLEEEGA